MTDPEPALTKVGDYSILDSSGNRISFWPLEPGTTISLPSSEAPATVTPGSEGTNTLVPGAAAYGIFDIVIQMSPDSVTRSN